MISACATSGEYASFQSQRAGVNTVQARREILMVKCRHFITLLGGVGASPLAARAQHGIAEIKRILVEQQV
jgi:hypothetical protein